jgi:hypothetical protein
MNEAEIVADFRRRYESTYIFVQSPSSDEETLCLVERIIPDEDKVATLSIHSPEFGRIRLNMGSGHSLKFKYPQVGVFQHGTDAYIFRRKTDRQYKHGICPGNSKMYPVYASLFGHGEEPLNFELVAAAFKHVTYSYQQALTMLKSKKYRSVALPNNFSLCLSLSKMKQLYLMHYAMVIAIIDAETGKVIKTLENSFESQVRKLIDNGR